LSGLVRRLAIASHVDVYVNITDLVADRTASGRSHVPNAGSYLSCCAASVTRRLSDFRFVVFKGDLFVGAVRIDAARAQHKRQECHGFAHDQFLLSPQCRLQRFASG
jgi:hypothetical protein